MNVEGMIISGYKNYDNSAQILNGKDSIKSEMKEDGNVVFNAKVGTL